MFICLKQCFAKCQKLTNKCFHLHHAVQSIRTCLIKQWNISYIAWNKANYCSILMCRKRTSCLDIKTIVHVATISDALTVYTFYPRLNISYRYVLICLPVITHGQRKRTKDTEMKVMQLGNRCVYSITMQFGFFLSRARVWQLGWSTRKYAELQKTNIYTGRAH